MEPILINNHLSPKRIILLHDLFLNTSYIWLKMKKKEVSNGRRARPENLKLIELVLVGFQHGLVCLALKQGKKLSILLLRCLYYFGASILVVNLILSFLVLCFFGKYMQRNSSFCEKVIKTIVITIHLIHQEKHRTRTKIYYKKHLSCGIYLKHVVTWMSVSHSQYEVKVLDNYALPECVLFFMHFSSGTQKWIHAFPLFHK
jgi:hypothetical protein